MAIGNGSGNSWNDAGDGSLSGGINVNNGFIDSNGELNFSSGKEVKKFFNISTSEIYYKFIPNPQLQTSTLSLVVTEESSNSFTVSLTEDPVTSRSVTVTRTSGDTDLTVQSGASLSFTSGNWSVPQTVTIAAAADVDFLSGSAVFTVSSAGMTSIEVTVTESDITVAANPQIYVNTTSRIITELETGVFQIKLTEDPQGSVTVSTERTAGSEGFIITSGATLNFDSGNWNTVQSLNIISVDDDDSNNDTATFTISSPGMTPVEITTTQWDTTPIAPTTWVDEGVLASSFTPKGVVYENGYFYTYGTAANIGDHTLYKTQLIGESGGGFSGVGNGGWTAAGLQRSTDGIPETATINEFAYENGIYVVLFADRNASTDNYYATYSGNSNPTSVGDWAPRFEVPFKSIGNRKQLFGGNNVFIASGYEYGTSTSNIYRSTDGYTWDKVSGTSNRSVYGFTNGLFISQEIDGGYRRIFTSTDGLTWTARNDMVNIMSNNIEYNYINTGTYTGLQIADGTGDIVYSDDGTTWSLENSSISESVAPIYENIAASVSNFVVVGEQPEYDIYGAGDKTIAYSTDGLSWTTVSSPIGTDKLTGVAFGDYYYCAVSPDSKKVISCFTRPEPPV